MSNRVRALVCCVHCVCVRVRACVYVCVRACVSAWMWVWVSKTSQLKCQDIKKEILVLLRTEYGDVRSILGIVRRNWGIL